jgi:uncharacterized protein
MIEFKLNDWNFRVGENFELMGEKEKRKFIFRAPKLHLKDEKVPTAVWLYLTTACPLQCPYCYVISKESKSMSEEVLEESIQYILKNAKEEKTYPYFIFFGGEPMLQYPLIEKCVNRVNEYWRESSLVPRFLIITSGTILPKNLSLLKRKEVGMQISLDGPKEIHNRTRIYANGRGTFDDIVKNIGLIKRNGIALSIRSTITNESMDWLEPFVDWCFSLNLPLLATPVAEVECQSPTDATLSYSPFQMEKFIKIESALLKKICENYFLKEPFLSPFLYLPPIISLTMLFRGPRQYHCSVGRGKIAIMPNGDVYPCQRFAGINAMKIGNIKEFDLFASPVYETFSKRSVENIPLCSNCEWKHICAGGCSALSYGIQKTIFSPSPQYCLYRKHITKYACWLLFEILTHEHDFGLPKDHPLISYSRSFEEV